MNMYTYIHTNAVRKTADDPRMNHECLFIEFCQTGVTAFKTPCVCVRFLFVRVRVCVYVCMYVCMHTCMYTAVSKHVSSHLRPPVYV